jgi:ankyrin repeat protein
MERSRGLFWIKGNPGTGKSVLTKFAVREMQKKGTKDIVLFFFIHGQGKPLQHTPLGIFRSLLNTMLEHFPKYLAQLTDVFEDQNKRYGDVEEGRWEWPVDELQEMLSKILTEGTTHQPVTVYIDALDECGEETAKTLLTYFRKQTECEAAQVRICVSSRHYPNLDLNDIPSVSVEERNTDDIIWFTRERLKSLRAVRGCQQIEVEILRKAQGGFQWVLLVTEMMTTGVLNGTRLDVLLRELASCPDTLSDLYAAILDGVAAAEQRQTTKLFEWVLFAERPLSAQELREALATDSDMSYTSILELRRHKSWSDSLDAFERHVKHLSRGLVEFQTRELWELYDPDDEDWDREAQLIHQSVADYLHDEFLNPKNARNIYPTPTGAAHFRISRSCLRYLTLKEVLDGAQSPRTIFSAKFALAPYATRYIFQHIKKVEQEGIIQDDLLSVLQWEPRSGTTRKLSDIWRTLDPDSVHTPLGWPFIGATALHVLAACGSKTACSAILEKSMEEIDCVDADGNTALMVAIREGHPDVASMLVSGNVNITNNEGDTALAIALDEMAREVILRLMEAGAEPQCLGEERALVSLAMNTKNLALLDTLIEKNVNLDGLVFLVLRGQLQQGDQTLKTLVSKLLKVGADTTRVHDLEDEEESDDGDMEMFDNADDDALFVATRSGQTELVNLLLSNGSSADIQNKRGETPLLIATKNNDREIAQTLLRNAPWAVEIEDVYGDSALTRAIKERSFDFMELLVQGGQFSRPSSDLRNYFNLAHPNGMVDMSDFTPDRLNDPSTYVHAVLSWAAEHGHKMIVEFLLSKHDIDADVIDLKGQTPLWLAVKNKQEAIVKLLLATSKVNVNTQDWNARTPIWTALENGDTAIVELLFSTNKANINMKDHSGRTLLGTALGNGYTATAMMELTLGTGAIDIGEGDEQGQTLLLWAVRTGDEAAVKLLLNAGSVDIDTKNRKERTPW